MAARRKDKYWRTSVGKLDLRCGQEIGRHDEELMELRNVVGDGIPGELNHTLQISNLEDEVSHLRFDFWIAFGVAAILVIGLNVRLRRIELFPLSQ